MRFRQKQPSVRSHSTSGASSCRVARGDGVDRILELCAGHRTMVLLGASGVGKSTLVNRLVGGEVQRIGALDGGGKGRHTDDRLPSWSPCRAVGG